MLRLGSIELQTPFIQAALSGYSDLAMRRLARKYGAPYTLNEVVLDKSVNRRGKMQERILNVADDDHPVGGQLMGADPDDFGPAAAAMAEAGYDVIDINFGCPVRKVLGRCRGGFLLSDPKTAVDIIRRVLDAVGKTHPVTVKMRRGTDDSVESEKNFFEILDSAFAAGVSAVTVHGRTVEQRYVGPSQWSFLKKVKRHVGDQVILGSGDLFQAEDCLRMMSETGVDGVTIARGCIGYPWIFQECVAIQKGDNLPAFPSIAEQREAIQFHWDQLQAVHGEQRAGRHMRKFGIKYAEQHASPKEVRDAFIRSSRSDDITQILETWYDTSRDWPAVKRRAGVGNLIAAGATS